MAKNNRLMSEQQVLDLLGIKNFRHMSKAKTIEFISAIPNMDREVAMKAIEQFPEYTKMARDIAQEYKEAFQSALKSNDESVKANYEIITTVTEVLADISKDDDLTPEMKLQIAEKIADMPKYGEQLDRNNKQFLLKALTVLGATLGGVVVGGLAIWGAGRAELPDLNDIME